MMMTRRRSKRMMVVVKWTCWTQGPGPHQSSPCPASGALAAPIMSRKSATLTESKSPRFHRRGQVDQQQPGALVEQAMPNVRRSCHRTLTVVIPGFALALALPLVPAPTPACCWQEGTSLAPSPATKTATKLPLTMAMANVRGLKS